jgi:hypothetical protein
MKVRPANFHFIDVAAVRYIFGDSGVYRLPTQKTKNFLEACQVSMVSGVIPV